MKTNKYPTGFTLLELLIVISIIAILAVVLVIALNPAETLKKARDVQRISDLNTLKSAISIYVTSVATPDLGTCDSDGDGTGTDYDTESPSYTVDGDGWLPIAFTDIPGGSPISNLPIDPTNSGDYIYTYHCNDDGTFELNAVLESEAYGPDGTDNDDKSAKDGGEDTEVYEVGTDPDLDLIKTGS